jgi:hypothetical protein
MAKVLLKKSSVSGNVPSADALTYGEVAINFVDGRIFYKNSSNEVKSFVDSDLVASAYLSLSGGTVTGAIDMSNNKIVNLGVPESDSDAATKKYVDDAIALEAVDPDYPVGDYGTTDSAGAVDAFGVFTAREAYDHMNPAGSLIFIDHGNL